VGRHERGGQAGSRRVAELLAREWGVVGQVTELGSFEGGTFGVSSADGRFVLKLTDRERSGSIGFEHAAMNALASVDFPYDVPRLVRTKREPSADLVDLESASARLLTWVDGRPLSEVPHLGRAVLAQLGRLAARSTAVLASLGAPQDLTDSEWDPRHAAEVVDRVAQDESASDRRLLARAVGPLAELLSSIGDSLPSQAIHCDITDFNVVCRVDDQVNVTPTGLIDFGDVTWSWRACEIAVTCEAVGARASLDPLPAILAVLGGYRESQQLDEPEVNALWPLILGRAAASAALSSQALRAAPSPYLELMHSLDSGAVTALLAVPTGLARAAIRSVFGLDPVPGNTRLAQSLVASDPLPLVEGVSPDRLSPIDLGVTSDRIAEGSLERSAVIGAIDSEPGRIAVGRWREIRLAPPATPAHAAPATLHLGADVFVSAGTPVRAPLPGVVVAIRPSEVVLELAVASDSVHLRLAGVDPSVAHGQEVAAGDTVGSVAAAPGGWADHVHVQLCDAADRPGLVVPREHETEAWLALCPDPSAVLGIDATAPPPADQTVERERRRAVVAAAQKLYYDRPVPIVRGWRQYLYDGYGRPYLDAVNNVAGVGHSHPRIATAASRQLRLLNTNSRFLYESLTAYAERIVELLPADLDAVFLVNSGSEACDLAVQLARVHTARRDMLVLAGAYHGWTEAVYELCSSPTDNPGWRQTIPPFVHVAEQPDPYRGRYGSDPRGYLESVGAACAQAEAHGGIAGFISEPLLGNQGAVETPDGYLESAYATVRDHGGLCIADEIQVGFGRTGRSFWAFEREHVVPDIVVAAKAAGNGHPIGIVVCRQEIAETFGRRASFFSSTGGGPVTCEIGLAVLDVMRDECLQENAAAVGTYLKRRLEGLAERHSTIGAVHGRGLYLGVDLVRDRITKEPWPGLARQVCERMRDLGVIVQPTGDAANVLKVKPPLCITAQDADYFTTSLDATLSELEQALL
jgi:4-aminobutyrate aminotransferase-like enzyme/Ser/Thr protein kinase RdoA (MazF antagonist)